MSVPLWPATLPQYVLVDGHQEAFGETRRASRTDTGPGKVFRRSSAVARPMPSVMKMTGEHVEIFEAFWRDDLDEGALPFTFPKPRDHEAEILVRFAPNSTPSWAPTGDDNWKVTLPLEVLP